MHLRILFLLLFLIEISCSQDGLLTNPENTDFCESIHRNDSLTLSTALESYEDLMREKTGVIVLEDGSNALVTRAWLSEYAEESIDIQYFIFSTDNVGLIAIDYLVRAADRGIKVRLLVDDILVNAKIEEIIKLDAHENISIKIYNPMLNVGKNIFNKINNIALNFRKTNQRMHNKTFTVDGKVVITGGRNIADEYFDSDRKYNFRDRDVLILGKETKVVQASFNEFWNSKISVDVKKLTKYERGDKPPNFDRLHEYACNPENFWPQVRKKINNFHHLIKEIKDEERIVWLDDVQFVTDIPGKNDGSKGLGGGGASTEALVELIKHAENSIDIQTPYLITTLLGKSIFKSAVNRGVKVRILTNSLATTDNIEAFSAYQKVREELLSLGVEIYEYRPDAAYRKVIITGGLVETLKETPIFGLHAKSMVVDNRITVIGTFNLDPRSANLNTECVAIINSEKIAAGVLEGMNTEFKAENSWKITKSFNPDSKVSAWKRFKTWTRKILPASIL